MDITKLSKSAKDEIAEYIKRDNLAIVNSKIICYEEKHTFYSKYIKRIVDIVISLCLLILSFPINLIIAIVTFFDVGNPIIFEQNRLGKNCKSFTIYKFRNMTNERDINGELLPPDMRVTKWGAFVRKTSLDELLNFVSILKGDMSLIGPRPLLNKYADRMNDRHKGMYKVKPGLECPSINRENHALSWEERFENYAWYAANCSFKTDVILVFRMFQMVFDRETSKKRSQAHNGAFLGYDSSGHVIYSKEVPEKYVVEFCNKHGFKSLDDAIENRMKNV